MLVAWLAGIDGVVDMLIFETIRQTMGQFRSFKSFIEKIDKYGMKSGIVKVIPPKAW